ncbi:non-specific lipid transfer protein GPI-anchored 15-like isoform X2 [Typha angustifolia]|uniref:non-specific lipid transfer protein GPI-anchored 15-like isoform X2 n=1 Tax=Typha angustifolia TaxID=59011 RepID=UPI003C2EF451
MAQPPLPIDCIAELTPCILSLNITAPSALCCTALNDVLKNQLSCLCAGLNDPAGVLALKTALELFTACNITGVSSDLCAANGAPPPPPTTTVDPNLAPPPKDKNTAHKTTWIGVSTFFCLLLI